MNNYDCILTIFSLGPSVSIDYGDGFEPVNEALVSKDEPIDNENFTNPPPGKGAFTHLVSACILHINAYGNWMYKLSLDNY